MANPVIADYQVQTEFDVPVPMRDGVILRANVYRPLGDGPFPVLLTRLPYGKDLPIGSAALPPVQAARRGYIVVVQDTRGRFVSEGEWKPFLNEREDGYDTVEWAATLPRSNGKVGMYGPSYFGFTQWAAARMHPEHLTALFPMFTWADSFDGPTLRGGAIELGLTRHWTVQNAIDTELRQVRSTGDPGAIMQSLMTIAHQLDTLPTEGYNELPVVGYGHQHNNMHFDAFDEGIAKRTDAAFIDLSGVSGGYDELSLPAYHIGGWYDIFLGGTLKNYTELAKRGKAPQKLLIGPWTHTTQDERVGSVHFGFGSQAGFMNLQMDMYSLALRWFDQTLKEQSTGILEEPPVQIFVMGINQWRAEQEWPLERAVATPMYFHSEGNARTLHGNGYLTFGLPGDEEPDTFVYDPANPVPTHGGSMMMHPVYQAGPHDQRVVERREDMLVFTSDPLEQPLEVTGPLKVVLYATTSAWNTDFVARLVDVHPNGFARSLADGIIRGSMRNGIENEDLLIPREIYRFEIDLWATSNVFLPGHRIRVDITSSNFPRWDRNLNSDEAFGEQQTPTVAYQTILHDHEHPSHIILPVVPA